MARLRNCTLLLDGWADRARHSLYVFQVHAVTLNEPLLLATLDVTSDRHTAEKVVAFSDTALRTLQAKWSQFIAVVTHNPASKLAYRRFLRSRP
ncbi:hypothetical protein GcM3_072027, partial [Golovinomyces cichoracearum]